MSDSLQPHGPQHARFPCPSLSPGVCSNSCTWVGDAFQPSHPLLPPSPPALSLSQHQGLFQWVDPSHQVAKGLELQHQSFQWIFIGIFLPMNQWILISFTINWFDLLAFQGSPKSLLQHHASKAPSFWCLGSLMVQLWHLCMTSGKTIPLTIQTTEQVPQSNWCEQNAWGRGKQVCNIHQVAMKVLPWTQLYHVDLRNVQQDSCNVWSEEIGCGKTRMNSLWEDHFQAPGLGRGAAEWT